MWTKLGFALVLFCGLSVQDSNAQDVFEVVINCTFAMHGIHEFSGYACLTTNLDFDFSNPFYYITVVGEHETGRTDEDVRLFSVSDSVTNAIPANVFQVFRNLEAVEGVRSGITSITPPNFTFATQLRGVFINFNNIPVLFASPFNARGATITHISLYANQVQVILGGFFSGLVNLRYLSLAGNNILSLPPNLLNPAVNLRQFLASSNELETLHSQLFRLNVHLEIIGLEYNNINGIGPNIFNDLPNLEYIGLSANRCIDGWFDIGEQTSIDDVNEALADCFRNSPAEPPRTRTLLFELRGNMSMVNEYNEQILNIIGREW